MTIDNDLSNAERETILTQTADDRGAWHIFTDDPIMERRLQRIGATRLASRPGSAEFELRADQVLIRGGKRHVSAEQRRAAGQRLADWRATTTEENAP